MRFIKKHLLQKGEKRNNVSLPSTNQSTPKIEPFM